MNQCMEKNHLSFWVAVLLSVLGGALMFASFAPFNADLFIWVGLVPLISALWTGDRRTGKKGVLYYTFYGWIFGVVYYGGSFWWINEVSTLGFIPLVMYLALYPACWAGLMGSVLRPEFEVIPRYELSGKERLKSWKAWAGRDIVVSVKAVFLGASLWVCIEWLRGWVMTGFGWNSLGVALYDKLSLAQFAEYVGVVGLSFVPAAVNVSLWCVSRRLGKMMINEGRRVVPWDFFGMCIFLMLMFLWGTFSMNRHISPGGEKLPVLAIQRNMSQEDKWGRDSVWEIYTEMAISTRDAIIDIQRSLLNKSEKEGSIQDAILPAWVIWPESSLPVSTFLMSDSLEKPSHFIQFNEKWLNDADQFPLVREEVFSDFVLVTGEDERWIDSRNETVECYNVIAAYPENFESRIAYRKSHLVPFGEYIPLRKTFPVLESAFQFSAGGPMGANFSKGDSTEPLSLPLRPGSNRVVQMIPTVCFEDTVGRLVRKFVRQEPQVIVNVTNDGWFNDSYANEQHWRNSAFRCIEFRRSMVRAANTGVTMAIAPSGVIIKSLRDESGSPFIKGYLFAELPISYNGVTLYALLGDWAAGVCFLVVLAGLISAKRKKLPV